MEELYYAYGHEQNEYEYGHEYAYEYGHEYAHAAHAYDDDAYDDDDADDDDNADEYYENDGKDDKVINSLEG